MRLYLSSYRLGDRPDLLVELAGNGARTGVITNATDFVGEDAREAYYRNVYDPFAELRDHGFDAARLDLRDYFGRPEALAAHLATLDLVWAPGGNTFLLRRAMRQCGFDRVGIALIEQNKLVYGGYSAGACVACPDLKGIHLMDEHERVTDGYDPEVIWEGLNLIPIHLVPHYDSNHAESEAAGRVAAWMLDQAMPYRTMRDGDVLIRDANGIRAYERNP
ncbi:MAG: Type 1 glutamine amidotransferase-like domain-containing protein [Alphaproteobacteria bacterium]|nr:Type 1 glutamine amidotransferase-like domain-containing protein [Alphaproteobacteria bacterium]MBV9539657.1 Type 1 glutamine amidotransferase-like domain-containing protein [Alphaproteobacteria bacterium]MBV9902986.1 Type 1 glutamine amidotransferase-like domain-containing protein [Alphaproteobacteria bacterium]